MRMIAEVNFENEFGSCCGNGTKAFDFLNDIVIPRVADGYTFIFDFSGVKVMNTSFSNAFFGNLFKRFGKAALKSMEIRNARPIVKTEIRFAIEMGLKHQSLQEAEQTESYAYSATA